MGKANNDPASVRCALLASAQSKARQALSKVVLLEQDVRKVTSLLLDVVQDMSEALRVPALGSSSPGDDRRGPTSGQ